MRRGGQLQCRGGLLSAASGRQAFVVTETGGTWGKALEVPGTAQPGPEAEAVSVSCASAGNCSAGGLYGGRGVRGQRDERHLGHRAASTRQRGARRVRCHLGVVASAGNCGAGGDSMVSSRPEHGQVFVADQTGGTWGNAQQVPGTAALNQGQDGSLASVSCGSAGNCGAGGFYTDSSGHQQAFVASETNGT